jgi:hypothetical protein
MSSGVMIALFVQITMQLAMLLTSVVVTHRRFSAAHNQLVFNPHRIEYRENPRFTNKRKAQSCGAIARPKEEV